MILSTLPTNARFRVHGKSFTKVQPLAWDSTRDNPDHDLYGVDPQVQPRPDAVHVVSGDGILALMRPDVDVEPLPKASEFAYRVNVNSDWNYGANSLFAIRKLIRLFGLTSSGGTLSVAIEHNGQHINADDTPCKEQGKGLQFRAVEARVMVGSVSV